MAHEGARVVISSRKQDNVQKAVNELKKENLDIYGTVCHVSKSDDRKRLFNETIKNYGKLDILVSNAAISPSVGDILEVGRRDYLYSILSSTSFRQQNRNGIKYLTLMLNRLSS